jgi:ADP-ribose pyrophosphatase YjhB (NUDIX family)
MNASTEGRQRVTGQLREIVRLRLSRQGRVRLSELFARTGPAGMPHVEHIHIATAAGQPMASLREVEAIKGRGLTGDRYAQETGFWRDTKVSRDITLIEGEAVDSAAEILGPLQPGITRRNVTTRGLRLEGLLNRTFWIGGVLARGTRRCSPCQHLVEVSQAPLLRPLAHCGGLRADLLSSGWIHVGDAICPVEEELGVGIVVVRHNKVLLGQRLSPLGFGTWSFPGGRLRSDESPLEGAIRELREETGLRGYFPRIVAETVDGFPMNGAVFRTAFVRVQIDAAEALALEPEKTAAWHWCHWAELPTPLFAPVASFLENYPAIAALE